MAIFQEKLEHACNTYSVSVDDLCKAIKISRFSIHLHATGQKNLGRDDMMHLCQYFDLKNDYFTDDNINYVDEKKLPVRVRKLLSESDDKKVIMSYQVVDNYDPNMTPEQLEKLPKLIENKKNE